MFDILSTIGLTASASLVIGFMAYAMAETPRGRPGSSGPSPRPSRAPIPPRRIRTGYRPTGWRAAWS